MFRFETVVKCSLIFFAVSISANAADRINNVGTDCAKLFELWLNTTDSAKADYLKQQAENCQKNQSKSGADCDNDKEQFNNSLKDFANACGDANMGGDCAKEVAKCNGTNKKDRDAEDDDPPSRRTRDPNQPYDVDGVKKQCPAMAGKDIEKLEKELKDQKDRVRKLEDELPKIEDEANTKQSKNNDKLTQIQQEMTDKQKKMADDMQKISEEQEGAEKAITDQVTALSAQIAKARDALNQVSVTRLEGQLKLKQTKVQADLNCHASASAQVAKMQTDVLQGIQTGTFNGGGFANVLRDVGLSDRQRWQKIAMKYYQWCLDSKPTMDTKDGANDGYRLLLVQADKSEMSIREQIQQLQAQQNQLMSPQACAQMAMQMNGSTAGGSELCKAARKAQQKSLKVQQGFLADQQQSRTKYAQLAQQGQQEVQTLRNKYLQKQREASDEKSRLDNLQRYLEAKYERSGGNSTVDGKGLGKAKALASQTESAAKMLIKCEKQQVAPGETFVCSGDCSGAQTFLRNYYDNKAWTYEPAVNDSDQINPGRNDNAINDDTVGAGPAPSGATTGGKGTK